MSQQAGDRRLDLSYFAGQGDFRDLAPSPFEEFEYPEGLESAPTKAYHGPPGTGKTYQLRQDVQAEIESGTYPGDVCATSYRREMAESLAAAVEEQMGATSPWLNTTHAICLKLLGDEREDLGIVDAAAQADFCRSLGVPFSGDGGRDASDMVADSAFEDPAADAGSDRVQAGDVFLDSLSVLKHRGGSYSYWEHVSSYDDRTIERVFGLHPDRWPTGDDVIAFERAYAAWKRANDLVDFEDMLLAGARGLAPPVRVLIEDEFQDKSLLQVAVHNVWAQRADRVYVAGDPNQAIYGYMGTSPRYMQQALDAAEEAVLLEKSYRNVPAVTRAAERVLEQGGFDAPTVQGTGEGEVRRIDMDEYREIVADRQDESTFHLFRTNYMKPDAANTLADLGIPFKSESGARWTDKQADFFNGVAKAHAAATDVSFGEQPDFSDLSVSERQRLAEVVNGRLWTVGKGDYPGFEETGDGLADVLDMREVLVTLQADNPMQRLVDGEGAFITSAFSDAVVDRLAATFRRRDGQPIESFDHHIETIHASKGREAETVFLFDSTSKRARWTAVDGDDEELRVWYVGITRSSGDCYVVEGSYTPRQEVPL